MYKILEHKIYFFAISKIEDEENSRFPKKQPVFWCLTETLMYDLNYFSKMFEDIHGFEETYAFFEDSALRGELKEIFANEEK